MSVYDDLREVSGEVLGEFNQGGIELIQYKTGSGSADNPGEPTRSVVALDAVATGLSYQFVQQGFNVQTDLLVTCAPIDGVTISENDFISVDGLERKIVKDVSAPAAGVRCVWKFIVRTGG